MSRETQIIFSRTSNIVMRDSDFIIGGIRWGAFDTKSVQRKCTAFTKRVAVIAKICSQLLSAGGLRDTKAHCRGRRKVKALIVTLRARCF